MSYGISMSISINSFEQLETRYLATKPIRGSTLVPLEKRSKKNMQIIKHNDDSYSCRFYNTDCVTYYRDGSFEVNTNGWSTRSTNEFMYRLLPTGYTTARIKGCIHLVSYSGENRYYSSDAKYYQLGAKPVLVKDGVITGVIPSTKQLVDREATKVSREKYMPFIKFARGVMEVLNIDVPRPERESNAWTMENKFFQDPSQFSEDQYLDLLGSMVHFRWYNHTNNFKQIKARIYRAGTMYRTVELPVGEAQH